MATGEERARYERKIRIQKGYSVFFYGRFYRQINPRLNNLKLESIQKSILQKLNLRLNSDEISPISLEC